MEEAHTLTCAELVELVTDYLDEALDPADLRRFEDHLSECEACGIYLEQIRITVELTGRLRADDLDERTTAGLLDAFAGWRAGRSNSPG